MHINLEHNIDGSHSEEDVKKLDKEHGYKFTEEHLEFLRSYPGMSFNGSRIVRADPENEFVIAIVHDFLSASDILFVLGEDTIMKVFEDIPTDEIGPHNFLAFSFSETEIFVVGSAPHNQNDIFVYSSITDETIFICNGIENFINNHLYTD